MELSALMSVNLMQNVNRSQTTKHKNPKSRNPKPYIPKGSKSLIITYTLPNINLDYVRLSVIKVPDY